MDQHLAVWPVFESDHPTVESDDVVEARLKELPQAGRTDRVRVCHGLSDRVGLVDESEGWRRSVAKAMPRGETDEPQAGHQRRDPVEQLRWEFTDAAQRLNSDLGVVYLEL